MPLFRTKRLTKDKFMFLLNITSNINRTKLGCYVLPVRSVHVDLEPTLASSYVGILDLATLYTYRSTCNVTFREGRINPFWPPHVNQASK